MGMLKISSALFCIILMAASTEAKTSIKEKPIVLEKLEMGKDFEADCCCSVWREGKDPNMQDDFVWSDLLERAPAVIKLDGKRRELKYISSTEKKTVRKGDSFSKVYRDGKTELKLNYKVTFACPQNSLEAEGCETTGYSVDLSLKDGSRKLKMNSLKGACGC